MTDSINDAIYQLTRHRGLARVGEPSTEGETTLIEVDVEVELPSRCCGNGVSATGVRAIETCFLSFGKNWPLSAPRVLLREDFPLNLPHINPHLPGQLVSPCLFEGSLDEVLHRFGLDAIVDQLIDWLHKAAAGALIDLEQGWEPTRRDSCPSTVIFSAEQVAAAAPTDGSILLVNASYITIDSGLYAILDPELTAQAAPTFNQITHDDRWGKWGLGHAATLIVRVPDVVGDYQPETVFDLNTLFIRATELGIDSSALTKCLDAYYSHSVLDTKQDPRTWIHGLYVIVVFIVQRPVSLVGSPSRSTEILPYVVRYEYSAESPFKRETTVHAAFHAHALSAKLLANTSGLATADTSKHIVMLGCGSLGSKIALHLGRAGFGDMTFVDNEFMSPHNVARHALVDGHSVLVPPRKAELIKTAFAQLSHIQARAFDTDVVPVLIDSNQFDKVISKDTLLIVDATASLKVLAAESVSTPLYDSAARLVRVMMYGQGRSAVVLLEGSGRGCRVDDITAFLFERCRFDTTLRASIAGDSSDPTRVFVGDNCSSLTSPMSDAIVSRTAALAGIQLEHWLVDGLPKDAQLCVGVADAANVGMSWITTMLGSTTVLDALEDEGWKVRVLHPVVQAINADVNKWASKETGGALLGRISYENRTITIAGIIDAPPDSIRERMCFVLGTAGLVQGLRNAHDTSVGYLTFIGTWHSHPSGGPHSGIDRETLRHIAEDAGGLPAVSLIWTPAGLICVVERW